MKPEDSRSVSLRVDQWRILEDAIQRHSNMRSDLTEIALKIAAVIKRKCCGASGSVSITGEYRSWTAFLEWTSVAWKKRPAIQVDEPYANSVMASVVAQVQRAETQ